MEALSATEWRRIDISPQKLERLGKRRNSNALHRGRQETQHGGDNNSDMLVCTVFLPLCKGLMKRKN